MEAAGPLLFYGHSTKNPIVEESFRKAVEMLGSPDPDAFRAAKTAFNKKMTEAAARFGASCTEPVAGWESCHICGRGLTTRLTHSLWCRPCNVYYTDAGWLPSVSLTGSDFAQLLGETVNTSSIMMQPSPMYAGFGLSKRDEVRVGLAWHLIENYGTR